MCDNSSGVGRFSPHLSSNGNDDRPFCGAAPPAAVFYCPATVEGNVPRRISPAGAAFCRPMPLVVMAISMRRVVSRRLFGKPAAEVHSRRKVFELADVEAAARKNAHGEKPNLVYLLAVEAVRRIDALFDIERAINGMSPGQRSAPLLTELER